MIERMHRTLKTAIKCHTDSNWTEILPIVLLGLRTTFKEDLKATPAEMVYGETLALPGEFFNNPTDEYIESDFVQNLRKAIQNIKPVPASSHSSKNSFIQHDLKSCTHVFVRDDTVKPPLKTPYDGPFRVINRNDKNFDVEMGKRVVKISIDRLKAAHLSKQDEQAIPKLSSSSKVNFPQQKSSIMQKDTKSSVGGQNQNPCTSRIGRHVHFPKKYTDFI
ncbi:uncharacterized protein LOC129950446 [Eupeodes corollae]|uniref:uncharacterized protein LOC129950446 n=1 Tax=Eupeodes corollae TaxID=290404 RepID=UPI00248F94B6|nr:uncharacterized protein LOC129950446 [Eupeodes corollae]